MGDENKSTRGRNSNNPVEVDIGAVARQQRQQQQQQQQNGLAPAPPANPRKKASPSTIIAIVGAIALIATLPFILAAYVRKRAEQRKVAERSAKAIELTQKFVATGGVKVPKNKPGDIIGTPPEYTEVIGGIEYDVVPPPTPAMEATDAGFPMPAGLFGTPLGDAVANHTTGDGLLIDDIEDGGGGLDEEEGAASTSKAAAHPMQNGEYASWDEAGAIARRDHRLFQRANALGAALIAQSPAMMGGPGDMGVIGNKELTDSDYFEDDLPVPDEVKQAQDVDSMRFCGTLDKIYVPLLDDTGVGTCITKCNPVTEQLVIWRPLAGPSATYLYVCRKKCPKGRADRHGFCHRTIVNPEFLLGTRQGLHENFARCGSRDDSIQHLGAFCIHVGTGMSNKGDFSKKPMTCKPGFNSTTPRMLSCYRCPPFAPNLIGDEDNGWLCAEPCPTGSSDKLTGSTYACQKEWTKAIEELTSVVS
ncbi:MAG: hypothetical protein WC763_05580 [Candidatus Paceibacterota bacterium]|jgi:hypothetical protein